MDLEVPRSSRGGGTIPDQARRTQDNGLRGREGTLVSIQQLRGVAALLVVLYHVTRAVGREIGVLAAGVDLFFVLSGFILWTVTREQPPAPRRFLLARAIRVLPLYWLVTLGVIAGAALFPARFTNVSLQPVHLVLSVLLIPHYDPAGGSFPIVPVGWTLSYELIFYGVLAIALCLAPRFRLRAVGWTLACIPVAGLAWPPLYQLIANPMFLELGAGVWLAESRLRGALPAGRIGWIFIGLGVIAFAALQVAGGGWDLWRPFLWGPPAAAILGGWVILGDGGALPPWPILRRAGDASYSLYLIHDLVIGAVLWLLSPLAGAWLIAPAALAGALLAGAACWILIERPMLAGLRRVLLNARPERATLSPIGGQD